MPQLRHREKKNTIYVLSPSFFHLFFYLLQLTQFSKIIEFWCLRIIYPPILSTFNANGNQQCMSLNTGSNLNKGCISNSYGRFSLNNAFHFTCLANHSSKIWWDSSAAFTAIASSMLYLIVQPCETSGNSFT